MYLPTWRPHQMATMSNEPEYPAEQKPSSPQRDPEEHDRVVDLFQAYQDGGAEAMMKLLKQFRNRPVE